jgi:hypothetical protein
VLHNLNVKAKRTASALFWGLPLLGSIRFLETQAAIDLHVPVEGDISDPKFGFTPAFRRAFQESLARYTQAGIKILRSPVRLVAERGEAVVEAPAKIVGNLMRNAAPLLPVPMGGQAPAENPPPAQEEGLPQKAGEQI